jgi:hypothetical protein
MYLSLYLSRYPRFQPHETQPHQSIRSSTFADDAMVDDEKAVRIVAAFDVGKTRIVRAPEGLLPVRLGVVALVDNSRLEGRRLNIV